jgi:predicted metallo-beta-lactamase superfamily hydrolase
MSYKKMREITKLAEKQGVELKTIADFVTFANENKLYNKNTQR